jgi:methylmalonyl-CoA mutase (EC 5.4.99.2)
MKPDFSTITLNKHDTSTQTVPLSKETVEDIFYETNEQIKLKSNYIQADLDGADHLGTLPGIAPYMRGPYPTMYVNRPWTIRQYAGFSTAEESNAFYRRNLEMGQKGLLRCV